MLPYLRFVLGPWATNVSKLSYGKKSFVWNLRVLSILIVGSSAYLWPELGATCFLLGLTGSIFWVTSITYLSRLTTDPRESIIFWTRAVFVTTDVLLDPKENKLNRLLAAALTISSIGITIASSFSSNPWYYVLSKFCLYLMVSIIINCFVMYAVVVVVGFTKKLIAEK